MSFVKAASTAFLVSILVSFSLPSAGSEALTQQFQTEFYTQYSAGQCGQNILNLIDRAGTNGINLAQAHMIEIQNTGYTVFGLVRAEYARGAGPLANSPGPHGIRFLAGGTNWQFHAVLELDGFIYDFDFGNSPSVLRVADYFEQMFLNEKEKNKSAMYYVGRDEKLAKYEVSIISAIDLLNHRTPPREEKLTLGRYLSRF